jgi:hypothetical protein
MKPTVVSNTILITLLMSSVATAKSDGDKEAANTTIVSRLLPLPAPIMISFDIAMDATLEDAPGGLSLSASRAQARAILPFYRHSSGMLVVGIDYRFTRLDLTTENASAAELDVNAHNLGFVLGLVQRFGQRWQLNVQARPALATDFDGVTSKDFVMNGAVSATWAFSDSASLTFGVLANKLLGEYRPLPLLGLVWRPQGSRFFLEALFPMTLTVGFRPLESLTVYAHGALNGDAWHIKAALGNSYFMQHLRIAAGSGIDWRLVGSLALRIIGGISPVGRVIIRNQQGTEIDSALGLAPTFSASLALVPRF